MEKTTTHPRRARRARRRRRRSLLPLTILLAALAIAVPVILSLLPRQPRVEPEPEDPHAGQVYVNDGANMVWLTPHKNLAVNPFTANDFTRDENGVLRYTGMSGTVRLGVDVSDYQSGTDWQQLAQQGVDFAILRVGYRGYTQGALRTDSSFRTFVRGARAAGIDVGVYFFSQAINEAEAVEEAQFCMDLLQDYSITYPIVFDWEPYDSSLHPRTEGLSDEMLTKCAVAFCQAVEANGYDSMVYSNLTYFYLHYDLSKLVDFPLWLAQYNKTPTFYYHFDMWQYSSTGKVPGIEGNVDLNIQMIPKT